MIFLSLFNEGSEKPFYIRLKTLLEKILLRSSKKIQDSQYLMYCICPQTPSYKPCSKFTWDLSVSLITVGHWFLQKKAMREKRDLNSKEKA